MRHGIFAFFFALGACGPQNSSETKQTSAAAQRYISWTSAHELESRHPETKSKFTCLTVGEETPMLQHERPVLISPCASGHRSQQFLWTMRESETTIRWAHGDLCLQISSDAYRGPQTTGLLAAWRSCNNAANQRFSVSVANLQDGYDNQAMYLQPHATQSQLEADMTSRRTLNQVMNAFFSQQARTNAATQLWRTMRAY